MTSLLTAPGSLVHRTKGIASAYQQHVPDSITVPDIIEFVCSDKYLNRPNLYPRQATLLKTMTAQTEVFTDFDYDVLEEWAEGFALPKEKGEGDLRYEGTWGIVPDVLERMEWLRDNDYPWFREVVAVIGRRGGKGYMGAIMGAYVLWNFLAKSDPQTHFGVAPDKVLNLLVFAAKMQQARDQQWKDINDLVLKAPCFQPYISRAQTSALTVFAPNDFNKIRDLWASSVDTTMDQAAFELLPKAATPTSGRGPTSFALFFDEMAHSIATGANRSAEEVYEAAAPSLDQFKEWAFLYLASSPWQQEGKFYEKYQAGLAVDHPEAPDAWDPTILVVQLCSWDTYKSWERTGGPEGLVARPAHSVVEEKRVDRKLYRFTTRKPEIKFKAIPERVGAIQTYDDRMRRLERANPDTFKVERRGQFAKAQDAYLNPDRIAEMFHPWRGQTLHHRRKGPLSISYVMHGDPGRSGDRFGLCVAHREYDEDSKMWHAVIDYVHAYAPYDEVWTKRLEDGTPTWEIDYVKVKEDLIEVAKGFWPTTVTFDQWNSASLIDEIELSIRRDASRPRGVIVSKQDATADRNWQVAETFKTALGLGLIHSPYHEILDEEAAHLRLVRPGKVDHPESGPWASKDVWDAVAECVFRLLGEQMAALKPEAFDLKPLASVQHGMPLAGDPNDVANQFRAAQRRGKTRRGRRR